jgi:phosphopantetheinyl transferase (holo-ACP synthase)
VSLYEFLNDNPVVYTLDEASIETISGLPHEIQTKAARKIVSRTKLAHALQQERSEAFFVAGFWALNCLYLAGEQLNGEYLPIPKINDFSFWYDIRCADKETQKQLKELFMCFLRGWELPKAN